MTDNCLINYKGCLTGIPQKSRQRNHAVWKKWRDLWKRWEISHALQWFSEKYMTLRQLNKKLGLDLSYINTNYKTISWVKSQWSYLALCYLPNAPPKCCNRKLWCGKRESSRIRAVIAKETESYYKQDYQGVEEHLSSISRFPEIWILGGLWR